MGKWEILREELSDAVLYTIHWSPWGLMDRWVINRLVPSEAGMFQLWSLKGRNLLLLATEPAYFGGLRSNLREIIDNLAPAGERMRKRIKDQECWFRFSISSVRKYLEESWFSPKTYDNEEREIRVREVEEFKKFPIPPPDIRLSSGRRDSGFGPSIPSSGK